MKIILGCGDEQLEGWIHVDRVKHSSHVDVAHNLNITPWPFDDDSAQFIKAVDILEHLNDAISFFDECWRVLASDGVLRVQTVRHTSVNRWRDPTHKRPYHPEAFTFLDPDYAWWKRFGRFYTDRHWKIISLLDGGEAVQVEMTPRKAT